jgi:hypothetical protein
MFVDHYSIGQNEPTTPEPRSQDWAPVIVSTPPSRFWEGSGLRERAVVLLGFRPVPMFITRMLFCADGVQ